MGLLGRLRRDTAGFSAAEFALILPILLLFSVGTIEFSRLILITQKLQNGSFILADLTARDKTLSTDQMGSIFLALDNVVQPFDFETDGRAVVSSLGLLGGNPVVNWQCAGSGALAATSALGKPGEAATLPPEITLVAGETLIAAELFFSYRPLLNIGLEPRVIRRSAFFKPRLGDLSTLACP